MSATKGLPLAVLLMVVGLGVSVGCSSTDPIPDGEGGNGGMPSSAGGAGGRAGNGGAAGKGGAGGVRACEMVECFRPYECRRTCGDPIAYTGCCPCQAPLFDDFQGAVCADAAVF